jgi:prolyl 4-hydroxylase
MKPSYSIIFRWIFWGSIAGLLLAWIGNILYKRQTERRIVRHEVDGYVVLEVYNEFSGDECDELCRFSHEKGMSPSNVLTYGKSSDVGVDASNRQSTTTWLKNHEHSLAQHMANVSAELSGMPTENQEMLQVAKYEDGGKFNPHFDACDIEDDEYKERINHGAGQRYATLLLYLNDDYDGGITEFVDINLKIRPEKGKAIFFWNTDEDEKIIPNSKHAGHTVKNGNKWICTKWTHPKKWRD